MYLKAFAKLGKLSNIYEEKGKTTVTCSALNEIRSVFAVYSKAREKPRQGFSSLITRARKVNWEHTNHRSADTFLNLLFTTKAAFAQLFQKDSQHYQQHTKHLNLSLHNINTIYAKMSHRFNKRFLCPIEHPKEWYHSSLPVFN